MNRRHFFEFEDLSWFPQRFRSYLTEILRMHVEQIYIPVAPLIAEMIEEHSCAKIVDLCSGGGGPWAMLHPLVVSRLERPIQLTLTDKYPPKSLNGMLPGVAQYCKQSVDATRFPLEEETLCTLFTGLHHLRPEEVRALINRATQYRQPMAIFEFTERKPVNLLWMLLSTLSLFVIVPFIKPFKWGRLLFTYIIPIIPLTYFWDSCISHLRSYTTEELRMFIDDKEGNDYSWKLHVIDQGDGVRICCLLGEPGGG